MITTAQTPDTHPAIISSDTVTIVPDADKTQEVVKQEGNFEVHTQEAPAAALDRSVATEALVDPDATVAVASDTPNTLISQMSADAYAAAAVAPVDTTVYADVGQGPEEGAVEVLTELMNKPQSLTEVHGDPTVDDLKVGAEAVEQVVTPNGVNLTPLLNFKEARSANLHGNQKRGDGPKARGPEHKKKPEGGKPVVKQQGQPNRQQAKAPAAPALLRPEGARNLLREAMGVGREVAEDGVHHINTGSSARTTLGRRLDMNARQPFEHPDLGHFESVGGLWHFIEAEQPNDIFRTVSGKEVRYRVQELGLKVRSVPGFRTIMADATWIMVSQHEELAKAMALNKLPYRCYYVSGELQLPQERSISYWYMPVLEEIAATLRRRYAGEEVAPDFSFLSKPREDRQQREERRDRPQRRERQGDARRT